VPGARELPPVCVLNEDHPEGISLNQLAAAGKPAPEQGERSIPLFFKRGADKRGRGQNRSGWSEEEASFFRAEEEDANLPQSLKTSAVRASRLSKNRLNPQKPLPSALRGQAKTASILKNLCRPRLAVKDLSNSC